MHVYRGVNISFKCIAGATNSEICNGWWNAWLSACKGFDFASKYTQASFNNLNTEDA